jgi:hypothetical protein
MNSPDISSIGPIPRKATTPLDRPHTTIPRPWEPSIVRRFAIRVPGSLRLAEKRSGVAA